MGRHRFSSVTIAGARKALDELGFTGAVLPRLTPGTAEALASPAGLKYHDGAVLDEVVNVVGELHGDEGAARLMATVTARSVSSVMAPLARVVLALSGGSPRALLERVQSLVNGVSQGLEASFLPEGPRGGTVRIAYPVPVSSAVAHGWRGSFTHLLTFCGAEGEVAVEPGAAPTEARLRIAWK